MEGLKYIKPSSVYCPWHLFIEPFWVCSWNREYCSLAYDSPVLQYVSSWSSFKKNQKAETPQWWIYLSVLIICFLFHTGSQFLQLCIHQSLLELWFLYICLFAYFCFEQHLLPWSYFNAKVDSGGLRVFFPAFLSFLVGCCHFVLFFSALKSSSGSSWHPLQTFIALNISSGRQLKQTSNCFYISMRRNCV